MTLLLIIAAFIAGIGIGIALIVAALRNAAARGLGW